MIEFTQREKSENNGAIKRIGKKTGIDVGRSLFNVDASSGKVNLDGLWKFKIDPDDLGRLYRDEVRISQSVTVEVVNSLCTIINTGLNILFSPENFDGASFIFNEKPILTPGKKNFEKLGAVLTAEAERIDKTRIVQQANSWHKQWDYDWTIDKYDWRVDNHFYPGWYYKEWADINDINKMKPEYFDFVTEFGAQALPCRESMEKIFGEDMWPPNWVEYEKKCFQKDEQLHWIGEPDNIDSFINKSQTHQAFVLKYIIEYLRMKKFTYCNGTLMFLYNDCRPTITWSVLDYYRRPKAGYYALKDAFAPILVMIEYPQEADYIAGKCSNIFIVNDTNELLDGLTVKFRLLNNQNELLCNGSFNATVPVNGLYKSENDIIKIDNETCVIELNLFRGTELLSSNRYDRSFG